METTATKYNEDNFPLYEADAYDFDEVRRNLAERYTEDEFGDAAHIDWDAAVQHELSVMDDWSVWEEIGCLEELDLSEAIGEVERQVQGNGMVLAIGTVGLWSGTYAAGCVAPGAGAAIDRIWDGCGGQSNVQSIDVEGGDVHVAIFHHDGRCDFAMRGLTDAGCDALDEWMGDEGPLAGMTEEQAHKELFSDPSYSYSIKPIW